jgi:hypothetical protein
MAANWLVSDYNASGDGTLMNFPSDNSQWVGGKKNNALQFDGTDDYVNIDDYKGVLDGNPFTIAAWIKTTTNGSIVSWGNPSGDGQRVDFRVHDRIRIDFTGGNVRADSPDLRDAEWHHVAATVKKNALIEDANLYVDGINVTPVVDDTDPVNIVANLDVSIGRRATHNDRYFDGLIDDVRIYDYTLSDTEVANIANETGDPVPGPLLWYKFDETSGDIAKESVGTVIYVPLPEPIVDLYWDGTVDFKDFAVLADMWLDEQLYP